MTRLKNPLDAFASYSTQFIILAARTTENVRKFAGVGMNATQQAQNSLDTLAAIDKVTSLGDAVPYGTGSDVYLVMDTRRFSQFTVRSMRYEALINGLSAGASHGNLVNLIEMTVLDSVGISFINYLQWLMDTKMQTNFDGMVFLIRVVFVGHDHEGNTSTIQSITIPAHLFKMEVNLDYAKGIYQLEFMPNFNFSIAKHRRWLNIGYANNYYTGGGSNKLGDVVQAFEDRLNRASTEFYNNIQKQIVAGGVVTGVKGNFGRRVEYSITLPAGWDDKAFYGASAGSTVERNFVDELKKLDANKNPAQQKQTSQTGAEQTPAKNSHMSTEAGTTITDVLDLMFKQVPDIQRFGSDEHIRANGNVITFYKHVISVTSDEQSCIVHVDVVAFEVPNVKPPSKSIVNGPTQVSQQEDFFKTTTENGITKRVPKDFFTFDYAFTGLNHDILTFDMKIQDLQFLLATNSRVSEGVLLTRSLQGQKQQEEGKEAIDPNSKVLPEIFNARAYDPFLLPMLTEGQKASFSDYIKLRDEKAAQQKATIAAEYSKNLSAFYAISPITTAITIRGNPDIMAKFNIDAPMAHIGTTTAGANGAVSATNLGNKKEYRIKFENDIKATSGVRSGASPGTFTTANPIGPNSYLTRPVFVKLNIRGPNVNLVNELIEGQDFTTEVLFDNYYVVFKVVNIIEEGVFTQQLELWSHNVFGMGKLTKTIVDSKSVAAVPASKP